MQITSAQVRAAYDALGLDYDLTLGVSIAPGYVHITTAGVDEAGHPVIVGGQLQRVETGIEVVEEVSA